jgi:DNA-dependent metalloprotease WSS1
VSSTASTSGTGSDPAPEWLPFRSVVLVMLHELAHCVHMNHRAAFWKVRDRYAVEMRELWAKGYTGEGLWGQGRALGSTDDLEGPMFGLEEGLPAEVCGGVYRRRRKRGKKRKRGNDDGIKREGGERLTYAERQQRRIRRKFGEGGTALGDDELARAALERAAPKAKGKGKPRVAQSARGRELRAQAALARLGQAQAPGSGESTIKKESKQSQLPFTKPEPSVKTEETDDTESPSATESEDEDGIATPGAETGDPEADMVKVCPDTTAEDGDGHVKAERQELRDLYNIPPAPPSP